ncbi:hypothetical protein Droror1_Dr00020938 [Drosera rotundifolia]
MERTKGTVTLELALLVSVNETVMQARHMIRLKAGSEYTPSEQSTQSESTEDQNSHSSYSKSHARKCDSNPEYEFQKIKPKSKSQETNIQLDQLQNKLKTKSETWRSRTCQANTTFI